MEKKSFRFQKFYLRWAISFIVLPPVLYLQYLFSQRTDSDFKFYLFCGLSVAAALTVYYQLTSRMKWFYGEGEYWKEDGAVKIRMGSKTHTVHHAKEILGDTVRTWGITYAQCNIKTDQGKLRIFSEPLRQGQEFRDSPLFDLMRMIREENPNLKPKVLFGEEDDHWFAEDKKG